MNWTARKLRSSTDDTRERDGSPFALPQWNHKVLIVEDETSIAEAYRDILASSPQNVVPMRRSSRSGGAKAPDAASGASAPDSGTQRLPPTFELTVVHDAERAIAAVKHAMHAGQPFTMGFFDVLLGGGMDGIELVKQIHEIDPELYAVFVTAYSDRTVDSIQSFLGEAQASRWDYLNKPFTKGEILQKARNGVTLWNLRRERELKDEHVANLQKRLIESERSASQTAVARGINHEFRNILTQILAKAELGMRQGDAQMREALNQIKTASLRAGDILKRFNLLANNQKTVVVRRPMYVHQPIEEALMLMSHQLKISNVKVCWIRKKQALVSANATSMMQVFVNLIINSIHAMGTSGQIDISIAVEGEYAEVRFRDYGPGVPPELLTRLMEPFFTTKGENGTGLGLAITKEIIESEHEGTIQVLNHEFKGLEIVMLLPLWNEQQSQADGDPPQPEAKAEDRTGNE